MLTFMSEILSKRTLRAFQEFLVQNSVLRDIEERFEDAGISVLEDYDPEESSVRRALIKQYYASIDLAKWTDVQKLIQVFEEILVSYEENLEHSSHLKKDLERLINYLNRDNFAYEDGKVIFTGDVNILEANELNNEDFPSGVSDLFKHQFPAGLPFGLAKPDFLIIPNKGSQKLQFGLKQGMWILEEGIYPNFSFQHLVAMLGANEDTDIAIKKSLVSMNQTDSEKAFFLAYAHACNMGKSDIPVLIPQAWVQWHSLPKRDLRATDSSHTDELYRIDFVSFWKNRRFAILVDDISHYSMKQGNIWKANDRYHPTFTEHWSVRFCEFWNKLTTNKTDPYLR